MAQIIGSLMTSHVPAIGVALQRNLQDDDYWKPFFGGFPPIREWLADEKPDVAVVVYTDHGLNFFLDQLPTFAVGAASGYQNADEGWGLTPVPAFPGDPDLSWHLIENLVENDFDVTMCQELLVDHAFAIPMQLFWPDRNQNPDQIKAIPVCINTVQHPMPSPRRCLQFGQALGAALASYPEDIKVVVIGTGGLSHQLDGERAGFINKEFDHWCMEKLVDDPEAIAAYSAHDLIRLAGAQGVEIVNWLTARAALQGSVKKVSSNYHIPISNTATGLMLLENAA